jgi:hypothetical protein
MPPKVLKSPRSGKAYAERDFHDEGSLEIAKEVADVVQRINAKSSGVLI